MVAITTMFYYIIINDVIKMAVSIVFYFDHRNSKLRLNSLECLCFDEVNLDFNSVIHFNLLTILSLSLSLAMTGTL